MIFQRKREREGGKEGEGKREGEGGRRENVNANACVYECVCITEAKAKKPWGMLLEEETLF